MFEHLDDPTSPLGSDTGAHSALREARRRTRRRTSLTATSCVSVAAAAIVGLMIPHAGSGGHVAVAAQPDSTTVVSNGAGRHDTTTSTTAANAPQPSTDNTPAGNGNGSNIALAPPNGSGTSTGGGGTNTNTGGGSTATPPPAGTTLEWTVTGDKTSMLSGNQQYLNVTITVHNPTAAALRYDANHCTLIRREKKPNGSILEADIQNATGCAAISGDVAPGQTVTLPVQQVRMDTGIGPIPAGSYDLVMWSWHLPITITGAA